MATIPEIVPDASVFIELEPEEVAGIIVEFFHSLPENEKRYFNRHNQSMPNTFRGYPEDTIERCQKNFMEGWAVLESLGILVVRPQEQYSNYIFSRRGEKLRNRADFKAFRHAALFPRELVHPKLIERVYPLFIRGDYETAVFQSYKTVEVTVRDNTPSLDPKFYGTDLMTHAFNPDKGPLTDSSEPIAERQALMFLFAGAYARFKNPSSHRHVAFNNPREAIELILFASHLLRILDDRIGNNS